mgnify:CR=1 FL=1
MERDEVRDDPQQRRLPATGRPEQGQESTLLDHEAHLLDRGDGAPVGDKAHSHPVAGHGRRRQPRAGPAPVRCAH